jgi:hypothetical protein
MGVNTGDHDESPFFMNINSWILKQTGAAWDNPYGLEVLEKEKSLQQIYCRFIKNIIGSPLIIKYTGLLKFFPFLLSKNLNKPWGWKDPLNSITLNFWLHIFPNAKVIYVKRHGIDVAASLKTRAENFEIKSIKRYHNNKLYRLYCLYRQFLRPKARQRAFNASISVKNLDVGIELWKYYNSQIEKELSNIKPENILKLTYENLVLNPEENMIEISKFCGTEYKKVKFEKFKKLRILAFKENSELNKLESKYSTDLELFGY